MNLNQMIAARSELRKNIEAHISRCDADAAFAKTGEAAFQRMNDELRTLDTRIDEANELEQRNGRAEEMRAKYGTPSAADTGNWLPSIREFRHLRADETRAVGTGGAFIPTLYAGQYYDRLRARSVVLAANPTVIAVEHGGSINVPKISASVSVGTIAENTAITPGDPTFANVLLDPKKFAALTLVANEALEDSNPQLREVVATDLLRQTATALDQQMLEGNGSGTNLRGLRNVSGVTAGPSLGANGGTPTLDNFADMVASYQLANADMDRAVWFMSPRTWSTVRKFKDSQNRYQTNYNVVGAEAASLFGIPVHPTTNINVAETVGTSNDCSYVLLVDMSQVIVGRSREVEMQMSSDYAFNADQIALRVTGRFDINVMNAASTVLMTGVRP